MWFPSKPSLSKTTIWGMSPGCEVTGVEDCCWAAASVALNNTATRLSIHHFVVSLLVSLTDSSVVGSHCASDLSIEENTASLCLRMRDGGQHMLSLCERRHTEGGALRHKTDENSLVVRGRFPSTRAKIVPEGRGSYDCHEGQSVCCSRLSKYAFPTLFIRQG
jgi:hypothetical protein